MTLTPRCVQCKKHMTHEVLAEFRTRWPQCDEYFANGGGYGCADHFPAPGTMLAQAKGTSACGTTR